MPYPLFLLGLRGAALQRLRQVETATVSGQMADPTELADLLWTLREAAHG